MVVGESPVKTPTAGALNTYTDIRVPVEAGDVIGAFYVGPNDCTRAVLATDGYRAHTFMGDVAAGTTSTAFGLINNRQLDIAATVEPDADNDGFGDETQDGCVGQPGSEGGCPVPDDAPPDTTITGRPKAKTKKKTATFEFSGTDTRAVTGFECSLDGAAFASCTSPHTLKVKKGRHTFEVRAVDDAANRDASVASYSWKVKRRKKK
jgi:hypothetical protein